MTDDRLKFSLLELSGISDEGTEFIPLMSKEDEEQMYKEETPDELPLLPVRNIVLFPGVVIPITVGRDKSIKLIKDAYKGDKLIGVIAQRDQTHEDPQPENLFEIGTIAKILKMLKMPDGSSTIIIQGMRRVRIKEITQTDPYFKAKVEVFTKEEKKPADRKFTALVDS
ncbi:LON peptidase substrate-binding domain-containing protein, partial [Salibacteraceae bacterium]|nr:LON peptidase substrate-binding domain-containing protein [Salibacteraceae bacterium]